MRKATVKRKTKETDISVTLDLDGSGRSEIATGIGFLDHMLEQLSRHGLIDLAVKAKGDLAPILADFHAIHERLYGVRFTVPVELVALRVVARGATPPVDEKAPEGTARDLKTAIIETRPAYFDGKWQETPHYDRLKLGVATRIDGPAIIRQYDTTTVLLPRHYAEFDAHGNILIWPVSRGK